MYGDDQPKCDLKSRLSCENTSKQEKRGLLCVSVRKCCLYVNLNEKNAIFPSPRRGEDELRMILTLNGNPILVPNY